MALEWETLFYPQSIHIPNDQWSDLTPSPRAPHASQMPKSISNDKLEPALEDATRFDSLLSESIVDPIFSDSLFIPNEYFLSDLDVLQPFENLSGDEFTNGSYSEPQVDTDQYSTALSNDFDQSPQMLSVQEQDTRCANAFPGSKRNSTLSTSPAYDDNINSLDGSTRSSTSPKTLNERLTSTRSATKRNRNKPDILSACWTSPLCPNHDQNGPPPDPSTCGGGCAPFLFANDDNIPTSITNIQVAEPQEIIAEDGVVEVQPRPKRRSGSDHTVEERDIQLPKQDTSTPPADVKPRIQSDSPDIVQSTEQTPPTEDQKQTPSRRRLPHNQVERKYRESLNTQLESLRRVVPSLKQPQFPYDSADMEDLQTPPKPSKAVILASATAYIKQMEKDKKSLADENQLLRARMKTLQALVKCDDCSLMQYVVDLKLKQ